MKEEKKKSTGGNDRKHSLQYTPALKRYLVKFAFRIAIFLIIFIIYITKRDWAQQMLGRPIRFGITILDVLWVIFMTLMVIHIFPHQRLSMALRKSRKDNYRMVEGYRRSELLEYVQDQNVKAWTVLLVWLCFNAVFAVLYLTNVIEEIDLLMLTVFYFLSDYICILLFCPFQTIIMKNKCCVNCRIYDWGHFMMFTPMLFIKNFFSWSLFFTSCVVLIHWEIIYARHPERFWEGSNQTIQCSHCKDRTCQIKNLLRDQKTDHEQKSHTA